jgi:hypothetical protein
MRARTALTLAVVGLTAAGSLSPAVAAGKKKPKPIKQTYTATAPTPDPTPALPNVGGGNCNPKLDTAKDEHPFTIPYPGTLKVDITGFQGDWAGALVDSDGSSIADSDQGTSEPIDTPPQMEVRFKKKGEKILIRACNFTGSPTATVSYVFTAS